MTDEWDEKTPQQIEDSLLDMEMERWKEESVVRIFRWMDVAKRFNAPIKVSFS
jgi:hypothetical protein